MIRERENSALTPAEQAERDELVRQIELYQVELADATRALEELVGPGVRPTRYRVTSVCFDEDGILLRPPHPGFDTHGRKTEIIDPATNALFTECRGAWDVEDRYEAFWNRLNDSWEGEFPAGKERVKVVRVEPLFDQDDAARGEARMATDDFDVFNRPPDVVVTVDDALAEGALVATELTAPDALFPLGSVVVTPRVLALVDGELARVQDVLHRHGQKDWGLLPSEDAAVNEMGLRVGGQVMSVYPLSFLTPAAEPEAHFWILTNGRPPDAVTTVLLPSEY